MKKLLSLGILCAAAIAAPLAAHADTLDGSINISFIIGTINGQTVGSSFNLTQPITSITFTSDSETTSQHNGDFAPGGPNGGIPKNIEVDATTLSPGSTSFSFVIDGFGTFTTTSIVQEPGTTSSNLAYFLLGTFTPTGAFNNGSTTFTGDDASLLLTIGSNGSIGATGNFNTPAVPDPSASPVPEPSSLALLGTGILGGVGLLRRRFNA